MMRFKYIRLCHNEKKMSDNIVAVITNIENMLPDDEDIKSAWERTMETFSYSAPELFDNRWSTLFDFILAEVVPREDVDDAEHWTQQIKRYWSEVVPRSS